MNNKIFTIELSEEARAIRDGLLAAGNSDYLKEPGFGPTRIRIQNSEPQIFPAESRVHNKLTADERGGFGLYTLEKEGYENIVLYIHGGAWCFGITYAHVEFCDELVDRLNAKVYMPLYPLAEKYSYKESYKMVMDLYDELVALGKPIFVIGDSAGGNMVFGVAHICKETGRKMPAKLAALSPCVDMALDNPEAAEIEPRDPFDALYGIHECVKSWTKGADIRQPLLSPLFSDVTGYPPTLLLVCTEDMLTPDILLFHRKLIAAGNDVTLVYGNGHWHVYPVAEVPERKDFVDILTGFCLEGNPGDANLLYDDEKGMIDLKPSKKALATFETWRASGSKDALTKAYFGYVADALHAGLPNVLPEAELAHKLDSFKVNGFDVYTLSGEKEENIVLFIHGGAWVMPMIDEQLTFSDRLVDTMNATVYMPLYPLGPQYGYEDTYAMLTEVYKELLKKNKPIYIMGDSAGGQLTLKLACIIRDLGLRAPEKLVTLAPCADLSFTNPAVEEIEKSDPRLAKFGTVECCKMWAHGTDLKDPKLSLVYADVSNLPDTLLVVGTCDILCADDLILYERMKKAGDNVLLVVGEGLWHVFSTAAIPERDITLALIKQFCLK